MAKNTLCPNINSKEWQLFVEEKDGDKVKAFEGWENAGYDFPQHILDAAANDQAPVTEKDKASNSALTTKVALLEKAKVIVRKKLARLQRVAVHNPSLVEGVQELFNLERQMQRLDTDQSLVNFVMAADRMISGAAKWIEAMENGTKPLTLSSLKRVHEYTQAFEILEEMQPDLFGDPEHKESLKVINSILENKVKIRQKFLSLSRSLIAKQWGPFLGKIEAKYRRDAELKFINDEKPILNLQGKDLEKAKKDFVNSYMDDHAFKIKLESEQYVFNMLVRTVDTGTIASWLFSPKDLNHDLMSMAVESLDKADWNIMQKIISEEKAANKVFQDYTAYKGKSSDPKVLYEPLLAKDVNGVLTGHLVSLVANPEQYKALTEGRYKGTPVQAMYNYLLELQQKRDTILPAFAKLGHELPSMNKSFMERIYANGVWHTIKEGTVDQFKLRAEDTEFGDISSRVKNNEMEGVVEVVTNENGEERDRIPIHYRAKIDPNERSYDILTAIVMDYHNALNFKEKTEAGILLEILKEQVGEADVVQRTEWKKLLKVEKVKDLITGKTETGETVEETKKGIYSNLYQDMEALIRHRVYGITVEGDPAVAKVASTAKSYASFLMMAGNLLSGSANLLHGQVVSWIETVGGKQGYYSVKDRATATVKYNKDLKGIINDIGQIVPKSKTNLLTELFNARDDWRPLEKQFVEDNRVKRMAHLGILMAPNDMGEHVMQSTVMYSVLNNIKVQDADGSFINAEGQKTKDRAQGMSLDEAMVINDKGELAFKDGIAKTEITDGVSEKDLFKISRRIRRINRELYGNYSQFNKSRLKRTVLGGFLYQMRGWFVPGLLKRWRGIGTAAISREKLRIDQLSYNHEINEFEEGHYTTSIRFIANLAKEARALRTFAVRENWNNLTEKEKGNVKKASLEIAIAAAAYLAFLALKEGTDDEDAAQLYAAYLSRRLFSELSTYTNPKEGLRMFQDPAPILGVAVKVFELAGQSVSPLERYEKGRRKGELKMKKKILNLMPLVKQTDRRVAEALLYLQK